jgi:MYXO-CTERM domain-containing protein
VQGPSVYPVIQGLDNARAEDPVIWYSGGHYHITVNWWDSRVARHLMSKDGVNDWKDMGVAYDPRSDFIRYTDGTVNHWYNLERPGVVMENGHVVAFTFAATDINKSSVTATDNSGSKIIVVPFDGAAFDADFGGETGAGGTGGAAGAGGAGGGSVAGAGGLGGSSVAGNTSATAGAGGTGAIAGGSSATGGSFAQGTAGSSSGGAVSGNGAVPNPSGPGANGCTCRAAGVERERAAWWSLPLLFGAVALRRRRRHSSVSSLCPEPTS